MNNSIEKEILNAFNLQTEANNFYRPLHYRLKLIEKLSAGLKPMKMK